MLRQDRFLLAILAGAALLVAASLLLARRAGSPAYLAEDSPEGVAFNYLLALQRGDSERAFGYLSPAMPGYPGTLERFEDDLNDWGWIRVEPSTSLRTEAARHSGERAVVPIVQTTFNEGGLFGSSEYTDRFEVRVVKVDGDWKLSDADRYWNDCWSRPERCRNRPDWVAPATVQPQP